MSAAILLMIDQVALRSKGYVREQVDLFVLAWLIEPVDAFLEDARLGNSNRVLSKERVGVVTPRVVASTHSMSVERVSRSWRSGQIRDSASSCRQGSPRLSCGEVLLTIEIAWNR